MGIYRFWLLAAVLGTFLTVSTASARPATPPYQWDITNVGSPQAGVWEGTIGLLRTTLDHGGGHIQFIVRILGGYTYTSYVTFDGSVVDPIDSVSFDNSGDGIVDTWFYLYEVNKENGQIVVKDYSNPNQIDKDTLWVR